MTEYVKTCAWCGETFVTTNKGQYYCCKRCRNAGFKHGLNVKMGDRKVTAPNKSKTETLNQLAKEALEHGLSYGQYVARKTK